MRRTGVLFQLIFGRSAVLRSYERAVIAAVESALDEAASKKFTAQIRCLPYRQREDDGRVVAFYPDERNFVPEEIRFANAGDDVVIAKVELQRTDRSGVLTASLHATNGRFITIEFDVSPRLRGIEDGVSVAVVSAAAGGDVNGRSLDL